MADTPNEDTTVMQESELIHAEIGGQQPRAAMDYGIEIPRTVKYTIHCRP